MRRPILLVVILIVVLVLVLAAVWIFQRRQSEQAYNRALIIQESAGEEAADPPAESAIVAEPVVTTPTATALPSPTASGAESPLPTPPPQPDPPPLPAEAAAGAPPPADGRSETAPEPFLGLRLGTAPLAERGASPAATPAGPQIALYDPRNQVGAASVAYDIPPQAGRRENVAAVAMAPNVWQGDGSIALTSQDQWIELVCLQASNRIGVTFRGDENDGWAQVLVNDVAVWTGNTYGPVGVGFLRRLEVAGLGFRPHKLTVRATGEAGVEGGDAHVTVASFSCGQGVVAGVEESNLTVYLPLLMNGTGVISANP